MIRLKVHLEKTEIPNKNDGNFYIKSSTNKQWTPKETHQTVEKFIGQFKNKLQKEGHVKKKLSKKDLTKNEIEALKDQSI